MNEKSIILSYNSDKDYYLLEDGHHKFKAFIDLLDEWMLDIWLLDELSIEFKESKLTWNTCLGDCDHIWKLEDDVFANLKEDNFVIYEQLKS